MSTKPRLCAIAAGGSAGHIFPALGFAEEIESRGMDTLFFTGKKTIETTLYQNTDARPVRLEASRLMIMKDFAVARKALRERQPAVAVGFGGLVSVPVLLAAKSLGIPVLVHEQNATFGLANQLLRRFADKTMRAFYGAGMPMRSGLRRLGREDAQERLGIEPGMRVLAVIGGSQGAEPLNRVTKEFVSSYADEFRNRWTILHLAGPKDAGALEAFYVGLRFPARCFPFYEDMSIVYESADLVLCRAGAVTMHELAFFEKGALLVPHPAARGHQTANARVLERDGAAKIIAQDHLGPDGLRDALHRAELDPEAVREMGRLAGRILDTRGAEKLAEAVEELAGACCGAR